MAVHEPHARLRGVRAARRARRRARAARSARRRRRRAARPRSSAGRSSRSACRRSTPTTAALARLRSPLDYWNELALLCDGRRAARALACRAPAAIEGVVLLYGLTVTLLLTYSRFGVALACLAAAAWVVLDRDRVESLAAVALGGGAGAAVFGIALALPGITSDGAAALGARARRLDLRARRARRRCARRRRGARARARASRLRRAGARASSASPGIAALALAVAGLAVSIVFAGRIWSEFTNPSNTQVTNTTGRLGSAKSNRWVWWEEAWHAFTRHPGGGTGAGTFELTNQMLRTYARRRRRAAQHAAPVPERDGDRRLPALSRRARQARSGAPGARGATRPGSRSGSASPSFFAHAIVDKDWNYVASCGPLFLVAGALVARPAEERAPRRALLAVSAVAVALAAVYSLAAPWLADRAARDGGDGSRCEARALVQPALGRRATRVGGLRGRAGEPRRRRHASTATRSTSSRRTRGRGTRSAPSTSSTKLWQLAYDALNNSYTYDRFGKAAQPCGLLDRARWNAGFRFGA